MSGCSLKIQWLEEGNLEILSNLEVECLETFYFSKVLKLEVALALLERLVKTQIGVPFQETQSRVEYLSEAFRSAAPSGR